MNKQLQVFLLGADETRLSIHLRRARPKIAFVDSNVWDTPEPTTVESIAECVSNVCLLWDRGIVETLPVMLRKDGRFEGPMAGKVIQLVRSRLVDDVLLSGRIAAGTIEGDLAMDLFVKTVWKALGEVKGSPLSSIDVPSGRVLREVVKEYVVGFAAEAWVLENEMHSLRDRSVNVFFRPARGSSTRLDTYFLPPSKP